MSYPIIFRKRTIEYRKCGHTLKETSKTFKVAISTIEEWEKKLKESGSLEKKALNRQGITRKSKTISGANQRDCFGKFCVYWWNRHRYIPISRTWLCSKRSENMCQNQWKKIQTSGYRSRQDGRENCRSPGIWWNYEQRFIWIMVWKMFSTCD